MKNEKLIISVSVNDIADIRVFLVDTKTGEQRELQQGANFTVVYEQRATERCQVCGKTYPRSEIVLTGEEEMVLCRSCAMDKYPVQDEDIPF